MSEGGPRKPMSQSEEAKKSKRAKGPNTPGTTRTMTQQEHDQLTKTQTYCKYTALIRSKD